MLKYMDMSLEKEREEAEKEKANLYIQYLSNIFSQKQEEKPSAKFMQAKREFERLLTPENKQKKASNSGVGNADLQWDFDIDEVMEQQAIESNE